MLTSKDLSAIIRLSLYIAETQEKGEETVDRIRAFVHNRSISNQIVDNGVNMNYWEVCNYVSHMTEEKKKIVVWEVFHVLILVEPSDDDAIEAYKAIRQDAGLYDADEWYRHTRKNKSSSPKAHLSSSDKKALATVLRAMRNWDNARRPNEIKTASEIERKYGIGLNHPVSSSEELYDAIDSIRIMPENIKTVIASEMYAMLGAQVNDKILYQSEIQTSSLFQEIGYEADLDFAQFRK